MKMFTYKVYIDMLILFRKYRQKIRCDCYFQTYGTVWLKILVTTFHGKPYMSRRMSTRKKRVACSVNR